MGKPDSGLRARKSTPKSPLRNAYKVVPADDETLDETSLADVSQSPPKSSINPLLNPLKALFTALPPNLHLPTTLLFALYIRHTVSLGSYSGAGNPPRHGDFEAQRHWMELTRGVPAGDWYWYELDYWGLDYPPLTALHAWICGWIAEKINPAWTALDTSRGIEGDGIKLFMRWTALVSEFIVFVPAVYAFVRTWAKMYRLSVVNQTVLINLILLSSPLLLIDHGHFQYNAVMLGFMLWTIVFYMQERYMRCCVAFVAALGFKQMALFWAVPVFMGLLGACWKRWERSRGAGIRLFCGIAMTTVASFAVLIGTHLALATYYSPSLTTPHDWIQELGQVIHRIFPVQRGLYEDKVANVWCALSVIIKLKQRFGVGDLITLSTSLTLLTTFIPTIPLLRNPSITQFLIALLGGSLSFFLFAFQVHEKSILLPILPAVLLMGIGMADDDASKSDTKVGDKPTKVWADGIVFVMGLFVSVATFSLFPLLRRDGLVLEYSLVLILWLWITAFTWPRVSLLPRVAADGVLTALVSWHAMEAVVPPPKAWPDLWVVGNVVMGCGVFLAVWGVTSWAAWKIRAV
ncbi:ALG6, ALG8 glycosyltransferase family-domain-containing protein [Phlyctochytrium arcticum]|nr:ALG6, ALG8 glycosyltransferase family-domain-containing protein [Phlyctochytrium arcticum]